MILAHAIASSPRASVEWTDWDPLDPRWYQDNMGLGAGDVSGLYLTPETLFRCSTVLAAVRFLATSIAMCPAQVTRSQAGGGREALPEHYAQLVLRDPNAWQTDFEWIELNVLRALIWGESPNRIVSGARSAAQELWPLDPWRFRVIEQLSDGSLVYEYTTSQGAQQLTQDEVLHFRGMSFDGFTGAKTYRLIRNAVAIALLAERHIGTFLNKGTRLSGLLLPKHNLTDEQRKLLRKTWNEENAGPDKTGTVGVLPIEADFKPMAADNKGSQMMELRDFQVGEVLRFLGVPGVVVGYADKTATYASAKEFFESGGIKHCVMPWTVRFERRINKSLILEPDVTVKFNLDALLRANTKDRYEALFKAVGRPWLTGNEAREIEDYNPSDQEDMDRVMPAPNADATAAAGGDPVGDQGGGQPPAPPRPAQAPAPEDDEEQARLARGRQFALDAAARVVRRELAAIRDRAPQLARDPKGFEAWALGYYDRHVPHVASALHLSEAVAREYAESQCRAVIVGGLKACETWETDVIPHLGALAFGEQPGLRR